MSLFAILVGIIILLLGRQVFWIFVAAVGAVAGSDFALHSFVNPSIWIQISAIIIGGLLGAGIAILLQPVAAALAGFYVGGVIAQDLVYHLHVGLMHVTHEPFPSAHWDAAHPFVLSLPFWIGGIIGAILMLLIFNWALIVLSSLYGAALIIQNTSFPPTSASLIFIALAIVGIVFQTLWLRRALPKT